MMNLYYDLITKLTEMKTGYNSHCLKLWELEPYLETEKQVEFLVNLAIICIVIFLGMEMCTIVNKIIKKIKTR